MSDLAEVKALFEQGQKTVHDLRTEFEALKGKTTDYVDAERIKRIEEKFAEDLRKEKAAIEERLSKAETALARPGAGGGDGGGDEMKSFTAWARGRSSDFESKAMSEGSNPDGGYLVPAQLADGIAARMRRTSPVRSVASIVAIGSNSYEMLVERGDAGFEWAGETETRSETDTPTIDRVSIGMHELSALPKVSQRLLDDGTFDLGAFLESRISDRFARAEAAGFVTGSGVNRPRGFLTYSTAATADAGRASGVIEHVGTGTSGGFDGTNPADKVIDLVYALQATYRANAVFMAKSTVAATMAKFKDGDGTYLLQRSFGAEDAVRQRLLGYPLVEAEDMPALAANSLSLAFGDFGMGYTIIERPGLRILRDPFSAKPNVLFYATKRVGGGVSDFDAIKLMKFI